MIEPVFIGGDACDGRLGGEVGNDEMLHEWGSVDASTIDGAVADGMHTFLHGRNVECHGCLAMSRLQRLAMVKVVVEPILHPDNLVVVVGGRRQGGDGKVFHEG